MAPVVLIVATHPAVLHAGISATLYTWAGILAGVAILGAFFMKVVWPGIRRINDFFDGWEGEKSRPGVSGRPGVMERLQTIEFDITGIKHEMHMNSGQSIKDIVVRTEGKVDKLYDALGEKSD